jgi:hypothetical protein
MMTRTRPLEEDTVTVLGELERAHLGSNNFYLIPPFNEFPTAVASTLPKIQDWHGLELGKYNFKYISS